MKYLYIEHENYQRNIFPQVTQNIYCYIYKKLTLWDSTRIYCKTSQGRQGF